VLKLRSRPISLFGATEESELMKLFLKFVSLLETAVQEWLKEQVKTLFMMEIRTLLTTE
jgi:hypothetical protein